MENLVKIQNELKVPKTNVNAFGKYKYRSAEDILEAVKPLLNNATLVINDEMVVIGERYYIKATATLTEEVVALIAEVELSDNASIIDAIADINAEESEDETLKERHDIPMLDYDALSLESLVDELQNLVTNEKVMSVKDHVEEIKKAFLAKYYHLLDEKKEEFLAGGGNVIDFNYSNPIKSKFNDAFKTYRNKRQDYYKNLETA